MRVGNLADLLDLLSRVLGERGALLLYGAPGTLRTRLTLLLCSRLKPSLYIGAGRHSRLKRLPPGVQACLTPSFYEELLKVVESLGLVRSGQLRALSIDEFFANLEPYRASLSESYVSRMALAEVHLLRTAVEHGGAVVIVCGEDPRTGAPLAFRYLRRLRPRLFRTTIEEGNLVVEERDLGDPLFALWKAEVPVEEVLEACEAWPPS